MSFIGLNVSLLLKQTCYCTSMAIREIKMYNIKLFEMNEIPLK